MNKQKTVVIILWAFTIAFLAAGFVMLGIGLRAIATAFAEALADSLGGSGAGFLDLELDPVKVRLAVAGAAMVIAGVALFVAAHVKQKELLNRPQTEAETQLQVQNILRDMGLDVEGNRVATEPKAARYCVQCGKPIDKADYLYCPYCSAKVVQIEPNEPPAARTDEEPRKCMYCGKTLEKDEEVCSVCGHKVNHD